MKRSSNITPLDNESLQEVQELISRIAQHTNDLIENLQISVSFPTSQVQQQLSESSESLDMGRYSELSSIKKILSGDPKLARLLVDGFSPDNVMLLLKEDIYSSFSDGDLRKMIAETHELSTHSYFKNTKSNIAHMRKIKFFYAFKKMIENELYHRNSRYSLRDIPPKHKPSLFARPEQMKDHPKSFEQLCDDAERDMLIDTLSSLESAKKKYEAIGEQFREHKEFTDDDMVYLQERIHKIDVRKNQIL